MTLNRRGLLIVFEGCDRSGKTSQCKRLVDELNKTHNIATRSMRFPERSTSIGKVIDEYLKGQRKVEDHAVHLLFSANRWELVNDIKEALSAGTNVIVDRYAFSGVAFSAAKDELSIEWCKQPDRGLPKPDLVLFLDVSDEEATKRGGFGQELYEKREFQNKVRSNYDKLKDETWKTINTNHKEMDHVYEEISNIILKSIDSHKNEPLQVLWPLK